MCVHVIHIVHRFLAFTYQYGKNILMMDSVVTRQGSYNHGIIVSDMLLPDDQLFQVMALLSVNSPH